MATTQFLMTMDTAGGSTYPQDGATTSTAGAGQNIGRYISAGIPDGTKLKFPQQTDSFNTPFIKFNFLDAYGDLISGSPIISLRMPSVFNISSFSDYSRADQIIGDSRAQSLFDFGKTGLGELSGAASETVANMAEAINYSIAKGIGGALGFIESAGLSGINQYEFGRRRAVNPMAQLLYKGPQYRKYQIPVPMKPRNQLEAQEIQKIIKTFRVASSPSYASSNDLTIGDRTVATSIGSETSFTFGYPHLVAFTIEFFKTPADSGDGVIQQLYKSKACVLESVAVDYGGQKLAFFEDGIPTEMNLTLALSEVTARTLGDEMTNNQNANFTIF